MVVLLLLLATGIFLSCFKLRGVEGLTQDDRLSIQLPERYSIAKDRTQRQCELPHFFGDSESAKDGYIPSAQITLRYGWNGGMRLITANRQIAFAVRHVLTQIGKSRWTFSG